MRKHVFVLGYDEYEQNDEEEEEHISIAYGLWWFNVHTNTS